MNIGQLTIAVTGKCNSRCMHCSIWKKTSSDFTRDEWNGLLHKMKYENVVFNEICLCGGEPFLRDDYVELVRTGKLMFPKSHFGTSTNATVPSTFEKVMEIQEFCPDFTVCVSLDGPKKIHDKIRGIPGSYNKAIKLANDLVANGIDINLNVTLNKQNYNYIPFFHQLAMFKFAGKVTFSLYTPGGQFFGSNINDALSLDEYDLFEIKRLLQPYIKQEYRVWDLINFIDGKRKVCNAGKTMLSVDSELNVYPCGQALEELNLGNLRKHYYSFKNLLKTQKKHNCLRCFNPVESNNSKNLTKKMAWKWAGMTKSVIK